MSTETTHIEETQVTEELHQRIEGYIDVAAEQFRIVSNQRDRIIMELAENISRLPGIAKDRVVRIILRGFRQKKVEISKSYIYKVLPIEYKSKPNSDASKQTQQELKEDGYDRPTKTYVTGKNYDPDHVVDYSKNTLVRIVNDQREEIIVLKKRIAELEQKQH